MRVRWGGRGAWPVTFNHEKSTTRHPTTSQASYWSHCSHRSLSSADDSQRSPGPGNVNKTHQSEGRYDASGPIDECWEIHSSSLSPWWADPQSGSYKALGRQSKDPVHCGVNDLHTSGWEIRKYEWQGDGGKRGIFSTLWVQVWLKWWCVIEVCDGDTQSPISGSHWAMFIVMMLPPAIFFRQRDDGANQLIYFFMFWSARP